MSTHNDQDDEKNLIHIRTEVQKIIDKYLQWEKNFSVMNFGYDELNLLIDLLTKKKTREDVEKELEQNEKEIEKTYDQIVNEYDFMKSLKNLKRDIESELTALNSDVKLESSLKEFDSI